MKPFHTIAVPHKDILDGKLTMEVFAADLWETHLGRSPTEYKDSEMFFKKTYLTDGLKNLLEVVEKRVRGKGGDPVIQIQTPFGGGKTHALIAMYHKAKQWQAKRVVISGTAMAPTETIWGLIEKQLTGKIDKLAGNVAPGTEVLRKILEKNAPALILIDELLEYTTKAAGITVKESSLAAQTIAFMQELTQVASTMEEVCVVITLPSSLMEHYDQKAEKMYQQLQKVAGRVEKIYTPVKENEITKVIRRRLFSDVDLAKAKASISEFMDYAEKEGILPVGKESSEYRERFADSYPFLPDVVEILYHRWGSFATFQRTRGVLRLLSLVIHSLKESGKAYISLADFDLSKDEIRRELIKHIGSEFDSVISADITNPGSGSKRVDKLLGKSYQGLNIASRAAASVFLYSFSGGIEKGAHLGEIKRSATTTENPSTVVAEAVEQLKSKLFFLQNQNDKYFFSNQPNLNRILLTKMENIKDTQLVEAEKDLLKQQISGGKLQVFLWPVKPKDISDTPDLKLVILKERNEQFMKTILESKGESPRIHRNTIFFLCPSDVERPAFLELLKRKMAYSAIDTDKTVNLSEDQKREIRISLKRDEESVTDGVRRFYRLAYAPAREGLKDIDLGIPTYGDKKSIDQDVYDRLRGEEEILEKVSSLVIRERYLKDKEFVSVQQIYDSMLKTPGESRGLSRQALEIGIRNGVKQGLFGLGDSTPSGITCKYFKDDAQLSFAENEVIIKDVLCATKPPAGETVIVPGSGGQEIGAESRGESAPEQVTEDHILREIQLRFKVPRGKITQIMGIMNYLQSKFQLLEMEIAAKNGSVSEEEYSGKIIEALRQLGIQLDEI
jgi:hypothetical protein